MGSDVANDLFCPCGDGTGHGQYCGPDPASWCVACREIDRLRTQCRGLATSAMNNGSELLVREHIMENAAKALDQIADSVQEAFRYEGGAAYAAGIRAVAITLRYPPRG